MVRRLLTAPRVPRPVRRLFQRDLLVDFNRPVISAAIAFTVPTIFLEFVSKRRRDVASTGGLWDVGVFVDGVLCTRSALGNERSSLPGVRAGRKTEPFPSACFLW